MLAFPCSSFWTSSNYLFQDLMSRPALRTSSNDFLSSHDLLSRRSTSSQDLLSQSPFLTSCRDFFWDHFSRAHQDLLQDLLPGHPLATSLIGSSTLFSDLLSQPPPQLLFGPPVIASPGLLLATSCHDFFLQSYSQNLLWRPSLDLPSRLLLGPPPTTSSHYLPSRPPSCTSSHNFF